LNLLKSFQNQRVQILCSYWTTDVSELRQELLKTGKGQPHRFRIRQISCQRTILFKKAGNTAPTTFESQPVTISPVLKSFQQIQKLLALNG
jgi:hypothetical protein